MQLTYYPDILPKIAPAAAFFGLSSHHPQTAHHLVVCASPVQHKTGIGLLVSSSSTLARPQNVNVIPQTIVAVSNSTSSNGHAQFDLGGQSPSVLRLSFTTGSHLRLHWACVRANALQYHLQTMPYELLRKSRGVFSLYFRRAAITVLLFSLATLGPWSARRIFGTCAHPLAVVGLRVVADAFVGETHVPGVDHGPQRIARLGESVQRLAVFPCVASQPDQYTRELCAINIIARVA